MFCQKNIFFSSEHPKEHAYVLSGQNVKLFNVKS